VLESWSWGQLVPFGEWGYEFNYNNRSNMPVDGTLITITIPAGSELNFAYTWDWSGWTPLSPLIVTDQYVVVDPGTLLGGINGGIGIRFKIDYDTLPGTLLESSVRISSDVFEERYDDNVLLMSETVNEAGPNLRVDKHTNWFWNGAGQLQYELRISNLGTQRLDFPEVIDTYPISTTVNKCWWNHGPFNNCQTVGDQVIYYLDSLEPGQTASAMLAVEVISTYIGTQGLEFINTAEISDFEDVFPYDNYDEVTSYTGPDVFVRKWLSDGEVRAGEYITFTVLFGNQSRWPWRMDPNYYVHITETLPTGLTFVEAIPYWDPTSTWPPEIISGQQVVWSDWAWGAESAWEFDLVLQVDDSVLPGDELLNVIEAWGDSPFDIDPNPDNNRFEYPLYSPLYRFLLPVIQTKP
jgi:uncharacterized repeat protein (TIGR01451 family)